MVKKEINKILKKYGLPLVKKQNGSFEKNGVLRFHEKIDPESYGIKKLQFSPEIILFIKSDDFEYCETIGAYENYNYNNFNIEEFEKDVKQFIEEREEIEE